jgi:hypothetical protein
MDLVIKQAILTGFNLWKYFNQDLKETLEQLFKSSEQFDIRPTIDSTLPLGEY